MTTVSDPKPAWMDGLSPEQIIEEIGKDPVKRAHYEAPHWRNLEAIITDDEIREVDAVRREIADLVQHLMELSPRIRWVAALDERIVGDSERGANDLFDRVIGADAVDRLAILAQALLSTDTVSLTQKGCRYYSERWERLVPGITATIEPLIDDLVVGA